MMTKTCGKGKILIRTSELSNAGRTGVVDTEHGSSPATCDGTNHRHRATAHEGGPPRETKRSKAEAIAAERASDDSQEHLAQAVLLLGAVQLGADLVQRCTCKAVATTKLENGKLALHIEGQNGSMRLNEQTKTSKQMACTMGTRAKV